MDAILFTQISIALLVFFMLLVMLGKHIFSHRSLLALFFGVYFADNLIIVLTNQFSSLQLIPNHIWEGFLICGWSGKLYSIFFAIALLYLVRKILSKEDVGLSFHQNPGSILPACSVIVLVAAWSCFVGATSPKGKPDLQTLVYLAIMPGLNEELIYRGYLLGILDRLIPAKFKLFSAPVGWGVIVTSLLFGMLHGFWLDESLAVHLDLIAIRNTTFSGFIFAWLKERTGSLLLPVVAHGVEDSLFFLPRMI